MELSVVELVERMIGIIDEMGETKPLIGIGYSFAADRALMVFRLLPELLLAGPGLRCQRMLIQTRRVNSRIGEDIQRVSLIADERREHHGISRRLDGLPAKRTADS
jgi:hypothetical protein